MVNNLPDDILGAIMKSLHVHHFPHCRLYNGTFIDSPILLTHVCRRWRQMALSLRTLWSCIHITPKQPTGYYNIIDTYLTRSGNLPLTILFVCHTNDFLENPGWDVGWDEFQESEWPRFELCWKRLLLRQDRGKYCAIFTLFAEITGFLLKSLDDAVFPQLEYLGVTSYSEVDEATAPDCTLNFSAPLLNHFRTDVLPALDSGPKIFQNLTQLKLNKIDMEAGHFLRTLSIMSSTLTTLILSEMHFYCPVLLLPTIVTLPRLEYLALCMVNELYPTVSSSSETNNITSLLCQGSSQLKTLHISGGRDFYIHVAANTTTFPAVQRLEYAAAHLERHIYTFLSRFPSLRELDILQPTNASSLLKEISNKDHDQPLCPNLHTLGIQGSMEGSVLLGFIQNRVRTGHPIQKLLLRTSTITRIPRSTLAAIEGLRAPVDISQTYPGRSPGPNAGELTIPAWDTERDRPAFIPWDNSYSWNFHDQF